MPKAAQPRPRFPYLYLPDGWDTAWVAAKAAAGATPAQILFLGDSIPTGQQCSDWKKSYPHLVRESLRASLGGLHADYFPAWGLSAIAAAGPLPGTPPWSIENVLGTSSGAVDNFGWHRISYNTAAGASTYYHQTFTSPDACTAMDLFYVDFNSGTWVYSVDGGADVTVTNTNAGSTTLAPVKRISLSGLASATHTIAVGKQSAVSVCLPIGVAEYPGGTAGGGLSLARYTAGGVTLGQYITGSQFPTNRLEQLAGLVPQGGGGVGRTFGYPQQPHLLVLELGINDNNTGVAQATIFSALRRTIQAVRAGRAGASILLHVVCNPDAELSDNTSNLFTPANWPTFVGYLYQFAQAYNCAVLNTHAKWGETPVAQGFMTVAGNVHPIDAGHADIAGDLLKVL
jgi:hypothetical protein